MNRICTSPSAIFPSDLTITESPGVEVGNDISITFNYQALEITSTAVKIGWNVTDFICYLLFEVQQIYLEVQPNMQPNVSIENIVTRDNSTLAEIHLNDGSPYFRIVAVFDNGSICSNNKSQKALYRFDSKFGK